MKKITILLTFWMLGCKTPVKQPTTSTPPPPPPPTRLMIDHLEVAKLIGIEKDKPQSSLILPKLEIDASQNAEQQGNILIVRKAATSNVILKDGLEGQSQQEAPFSVSNLNFGTVTVKRQNETFTFYNVDVTQFIVKEWIVTNPAPNPNRTTEEKREKISDRIKQLENRIKDLPPSSALRNNPPEYEKYRNILNKVKEDIQNRYCTPEQIRMDKALLDKLELVFDDLEQEAAEKAITLKSFFGTGSHQLEASGKQKLQDIVKMIEKRIEAKRTQLKPDMEVKVKIQITGHSDAQWITEKLQKELQLTFISKGSDNSNQKDLNIELSKKRIRSVTAFFKEKLKNNVEIKDQGLGQMFPVDYKSAICENTPECKQPDGKSHPYACANRRVCLISCAVHLDVKVPEPMTKN